MRCGVLEAMKRRWWLLLAPLVLLAACSSGGHTAAPTTSSTKARTTTSTKAPTTTSSTKAPSTSSTTATTSGGTTTTTSSSPPAQTARGTRVLYAAPVDQLGDPTSRLPVSKQVSGDCERGSDVIGNVEVYRCGAGNALYDPCWSDSSGGVLCMGSPWATSLARIEVAGVPPGVTVTTPNLDDPWGVELTSGARCLALQGAHSRFGSSVVNYACTGGTITGLDLLNDANRSTPYWTYQSATYKGSGYVAGPTVSVASAWFGGPAPTNAPACQGPMLSVTATAPTPSAGMAWLVFENTSSATCRLFGYPGVAALDSSGKQVQQISRAPSSEVYPLAGVLISPRATASAVLNGDPNYPNGSCPTYQQLLVTPPNTTASTKVPVHDLVICAGAQINPVTVSGPPLSG